jgi:para-nitrobenzyl esterase
MTSVLTRGLGIAASALLMASTAASSWAGAMIAIAGDPVSTSGGPVAGTKLDSGVKAYFGIPFAKPPTQGLRWKPPEPMTWKGVWNADHKGPECIQVLRPHNINHYFGEEASSEDCLYMNIWAPPTAKPGAKLPVIVFIYGGGSTVGSSGMANYDGETIAKRGAVFVNFNYRLGILGFMAHPELTKEQGGHSGDYAYLDQNAALKWIHDNIAQFGGDPAKVVITGQSAGAGGVAAQLFSPLSKGLFRGAMMSSACNYNGAIPTLADGEKIGLDIQQRMGAASLDDMRQVPADRILALQAESQLGVRVQGVRAGPVIDGYFFTKPKLAVLQAHEFNDVPIIASSNHEDLNVSNPLVRAKTVAQYKEIVGKLYGDNAEAFLKLYPAKNDAEVYQVALKAARESGMEAASRTCAQLQAKYNMSATYIDLFTHVHPYAPGVKIADQDPATAGAYHTADIPYWFDTLDKYNMFRTTRVWGAWDRELADRMSGSLIAFANTGSPATTGVPWPAWSAANERKIEFGDTIAVVKIDTQRMDWLAAHPAAVTLGQPPAAPGLNRARD